MNMLILKRKLNLKLPFYLPLITPKLARYMEHNDVNTVIRLTDFGYIMYTSNCCDYSTFIAIVVINDYRAIAVYYSTSNLGIN